jgi:uncharacterized protein YuzE
MIYTKGQLVTELDEYDDQMLIEIKGLGQITNIEVNDEGNIVLISEDE